MIHADIEIARFNELQQARPENLKLLHAFREMRCERSLLLLQPRYMRIAEQRNPIRRQLDDLINCVRKGLRCLIRQSVN